MTSFVVQTKPEAGAAPLHTCLRRRGKCSTGVIAPFVIQNTPKSRSGSTVHVSSKARQIAPRESSRLSSSRAHLKPEAAPLHSYLPRRVKCFTGVVAPFIVQATPEAKKTAPLHSYLPRRVKSSTGVIAPFIVQSTPEAGAAPLHTCLRRRGKLLHRSHRANRHQDHTGSRSGSTALVSPMAREMTRAWSLTPKAQRFLCLCLAFFVAFSSSCCSSLRRASALRSATAI